MKMRTPALAPLVCLTALFGCAQASSAAPNRDSGTGTGKADSLVFDIGGGDDATTSTADGSAGDGGGGADAEAATETGEPCGTVSQTESTACGKCGTQTRTCGSDNFWGPYGPCTGENPAATCSIGETRSAPCGTKCGTESDTCDVTTCTWLTGACAGEGDCSPGDTSTTTASCSTVGEIRTRTCDTTCKWGGYGACALPTGWLKMAAPPTALDGRAAHSAVWTGAEMLIYGGYGAYTAPSYSYIRSDGYAYNLSGDAWRTLPATNSPGQRYLHTAVWTGSQMLIWGGEGNGPGCSSYCSSGSIYDRSSDSWVPMAASPLAARYGHGAVWSTTTNQMIVWGGYGSCAGTYCADGAIFTPSSSGGTWTAMKSPPPSLAGRYNHIMYWSGTEVVIWGGQNGSTFLRDGARFDPATGIWTTFSPPDSTIDGRTFSQWAVDDSGDLIVSGGYNTSSTPYGRATGAIYAPGAGWTTMTPASDTAFGGTTSTALRWFGQAFFGGKKLYVFSGLGGAGYGTLQSGGAIYDPAADSWSTWDTTAAPTSRQRASVVWTGHEAIIWGGSGGTSSSLTYVSAPYYADGAIFRP